MRIKEFVNTEVLVTGSAGFIGSHLTERLLSEGYNVTGINNFDFIEMDIRDNDKLNTLDGNFDAIVHLAAKAVVRPSINDPIGYQETNVYGTQNLLEFAKKRNVKQFIYASSSSVYYFVLAFLIKHKYSITLRSNLLKEYQKIYILNYGED